MNIPTIISIALALSMDAFAVSVTSGLTIRCLRFSHALRIALFFGGFQAIMPVIGWFSGTKLKGFITEIDHWIAFGLLFIIGARMIYGSGRLKSGKGGSDPCDLRTLLFLAVATSIDALAVGVSLSFIDVAIITPSIIIGLVTFTLSFIGVYIGERFGHFFESKLEIAGGLILIAIGVKILIEHLS